MHRIYYYDAKPIFGKKPIPLTGSSDNLSYFDLSITPQYAANVNLLKDLRKEPFFAIRLGDVTFRGWAVKQYKLKPDGSRTSLTVKSGDLKPNIQQNDVDLRIGLDIATLALKQQVEIIVLVTGDSEFIPALNFAGREGNLYEHADLWIDEPLENSQNDPILEKGEDEPNVSIAD